MPISGIESIVIILVVSVTTFLTRFLPFAIFPPQKEIPKVIKYLGNVLPPAVIGMLVVYCLKSMKITGFPFGLPEIIASVTVILLHLWKRSNLLSIGVGTVLYMVLVQTVFAP